MNETCIRIGALGPLTLPGLTLPGHELRDGMTLAVEHINSNGGILGKPLMLMFEDTGGKPKAGLAAVEKLLGEGVHGFVGEFHSVVADAIVESIQRSTLPFVCASATMDSVTARRLSVVFRLAPPQSYGWSIYADCLAFQGFRHVVALQEDNPYWSAGSRVIGTRLHDKGIRFTQLPLNGGSAGLAGCMQQLQRLCAEDPAPDILLMLVAYPEPFATLAHQAGTLGLVPPACFVGDPAGRVACPDRESASSADPVQVPFLSYMRSEHFTREGRRMARDFRDRCGREPTFVAFEGYDSVLVFAQAIAEAATVDPTAVCNSLRKISVPGTRGTIRFSTEPDGVVHQQWKWPPVCVVAYRRPGQPFPEAELLWDSEHGHGGQARLLRPDGNLPVLSTSKD